MAEIPTEFEISQWRKEARRLITCTGCFGVGQKHQRSPDSWLLCEICNGMGKSAAEPHVIRLCEEVERLRILVEGEE